MVRFAYFCLGTIDGSAQILSTGVIPAQGLFLLVLRELYSTKFQIPAKFITQPFIWFLRLCT